MLQNLMSKLQDKADLECGEKSDVKFRNKKVSRKYFVNQLYGLGLFLGL